METKTRLAILGDAFLEEFRPVREKKDTSDKARVPVYEVDPNLDQFASASPGGSAFLAYLLSPFVEDLLVAIPARESHSLVEMLRQRHTQSGGAPNLVLLPAAKSPSRIEGLYLAAKDRWLLASRCDELHSLPSSELPSLPEASVDFLVIDDHGRRAVSSHLLQNARTLKPSKVILFAQFENASAYQEFLETAPETTVLCTERQALLWSGMDSPPPRLPRGTPKDHLSLLKRIYYGMRSAFPRTRDILIICGTGPLSCYHFAPYDGAECLVKYYEVDHRENEFSSTPGITTFFLSLLYSKLDEGNDSAPRY